MLEIQNSEIARTFNEVADLLEIQGDNPFRIRAYRNAARTLLNLSESITQMIQEKKDLTDLPGIGEDLASKIKEILETGHLALFDRIEKKIPRTLIDLLRVPSLGPKRIKLLYDNFKINSLKDLKELVHSDKILKIKGFGEKIRKSIIEGVEKIQDTKKTRVNLAQAKESVDIVLNHLKKISLQKLSVAGSFRRKQETVGDIDILATSENLQKVMDHFLKLKSIAQILSQGPTRSTVVLHSGMQVDLRVVANESYGSALLYLTGSKAHNIQLRTMALKKRA